MSRASGLYRLQKLDLERDSLNGRLDEIRSYLEDSGELEQLRAVAASREETAVTARAQAKRAHREVEDQRIKIEKTEQALYSGQVKDPRELEDFQMEAHSLKGYLETLEDRYLEAMLAQDEAEAAHVKSDNALSAMEEQRAVSNSELIQEQASIDRRLADLAPEREVALASVSAEDLEAYELLRSRNRGIAVAGLDGDGCGACGLTLSASSQQLARSGGELVRCSQCGRILYGG